MTERTPIIISVAPNGARKTKEILPALPVTPEELAEEAKACRDAGASLIHLHVRDDHQGHILDAGRYREATKAIREAAGDELIIQCTSEAVAIYQPEEQMQVIRALKPEAASFGLRELIPDPSYEETARDFFRDITQAGIFPQYILYSPADIRYFHELVERRILPAEKLFILLVLGRKPNVGEQAPDATPEDLDPFLPDLQRLQQDFSITWAMCAFGRNELNCMMRAVKLGGHPRIGFENNHHLKDGSVAENNAALIRQFAESAEAAGYEIAGPSKARAMLGL